MLWQRKLYFRVAEMGQSSNILDLLKERKTNKKNKPRFIISTDGKEFSALDTKVDESIHCDFNKLNDHFDFFLPLAGIDKYTAVKENKADIKAAGRLQKFYNEIMLVNEGWNTEKKRHALNQFMTRVLFCLFSEDTGSFKQNLFIKTITEFGGNDGEELQSLLTQVFVAMNTPKKHRGDIPIHIDAFPYVNGGLFADNTEVPIFSKRAKRVLIEAARLDWQDINPDIFGSMIQAVVDDGMRGDLGMHYTSVPNIMKVLHPLFLMSLEEEFEDANGHREERARLKKLLIRLSKIRVFDPACGSGNFLIIAYRELRSLEMRIFQREDELDRGQSMMRWESCVSLSNFYGIELADFAAETAKLSLWIAEYQMNQRFKSLFGESPPDFPLKEGGHITHGNALRVDWLDTCPYVNDEEVETYIVGNPPFTGARGQKKEHKDDMRYAMQEFTGVNSLDYVSAWFWKAVQFGKKVKSSAAFVATSSICQGQSISLLWEEVLKNVEIIFAHRPFMWKNNAKSNAAVTCIIVCIGQPPIQNKTIYHSDMSNKVDNISPYLTNNPNIIVHKRPSSFDGRPELVSGNQAIDGGYLILTKEEMDKITFEYPHAKAFFRPVYGAKDFVNNSPRYCIWVKGDELEEAIRIPEFQKRFNLVKKYRSEHGEVAQSLVDISYRFRYVHEANDSMIVIPRTTTERREYIPIGLIASPAIVTDAIQVIYDPEIYAFSILSSKVHVCWIKAVAGRLKMDPRYSNTLVYNTFPIPPLSEDQKQVLENHAWKIIEVRESHIGKTIAWLYDPDTMPADLWAAHQALDVTLEKIYIGRRFKDDTERLEHLFKLYAEMTSKKGKVA